MMQMASGD